MSQFSSLLLLLNQLLSVCCRYASQMVLMNWYGYPIESLDDRSSVLFIQVLFDFETRIVIVNLWRLYKVKSKIIYAFVWFDIKKFSTLDSREQAVWYSGWLLKFVIIRKKGHQSSRSAWNFPFRTINRKQHKNYKKKFFLDLYRSHKAAIICCIASIV